MDILTSKMKNLIDLKNQSSEMHEETFEFLRLRRVLRHDGAHLREKHARAFFSTLNKGPLLEQAMEIMEFVHKMKAFVESVVAYSTNETNNKTEDFVACVEKSFTESDNHTVSTAQLDEQIQAINEKLNSWGDSIVTDMNTYVEEKIKEILPEIVDRTVKDVSMSNKFTKSWSDLFKKSQDELKSEASKAFNETLVTTLKDNQYEVIENITAKQEYENFEKERRLRNIVIGGIPESKDEKSPKRIEHDIAYTKRICGLEDSQIVRCFRAGMPEETRTQPRLLIVTVASPQLAQELHMFGNGKRYIINGSEWWINPDLTQSERKANFNARQIRRERQRQK